MNQTTSNVISRRLQFLSVLRRYPGYRRYYIGMVASVFSYRMIVDFSLGWLMYDLTGDPRDLGYLGAAIALPTVCFNLFGGVFADKLDPRRLIGMAEGISAVQMGVLGVLTLTDRVEPWHVVLAAALFGAAQAFDSPARNSMYPRLVERQDFGQVVALNALVWTGSRVVAPSVAGLMVAGLGFGTGGVAPTIFMASAGFSTMTLLVQTIGLSPAERARGHVVREMASGFAFIKGHPLFLALVSLSLVNSLFGMSYLLMMPVFARDILEVGETGMGWLITAQGIGGIVGILMVAQLSNSERLGWTIIGGSAAFGIFVALFAVTPWFMVSLPLVVVIGIANSFYMMGSMTTLQTFIPNEYRGRVIGVYTTTHSMIPLGALQAGFVSSLVSPQFAVSLGGVLVLCYALFLGFGTRGIRAIGPARLATN